MNFFRKQKQAQENVHNYFIPASIETIERLTEKSLALLKSIKEMQSRIDESVNFINGNSPFKNEQKDNAELETRVRAKQRLLTSYKKVLEEINKQVSSL